MINVLLKKQLTERLSALKKDKSRIDWLGALLTLVLTAGLIAICVIVLSRLVQQYSAIRLNGVTDPSARQFELSTLIYAAIILIGVISGTREINFALYEGDDRNILITLPVKASDIFYSKLIAVYAKQVAVTAITVLPVNLTLAAVTGQSAYYVIMTLLACPVLPIITLAFASVLAIPYYFIKKFMGSKYALSLLLVTAITGLVFWFYSSILSFVKTLLTTGEIRFFFNENTMNGIIRAANGLYPANLFARILLRVEVGKSIGVLIAFIVGAGALGYLVIALTYNKTMQLRTAQARPVLRARGATKAKSPFSALLLKEFSLIFRTPSYAFQYFSVAAIMPLMVYFCMGIGSDLLTTLVMTENNFQLALFLILIFGSLTNTFCATNISREGPAFYTLKTMPVRFSTVIGAKIFFCSLVSLISTLISVIVVGALGYVNAGEAIFILFVAATLAEAQICFATRKDLNRPSFSSDEDCEVRESNGTISQIVVLGLLTAAVLGGVSLFLSVYNGYYKGQNADMQTMLFSGLVSAALLAASICYLFVGLRKKVETLTEG